MCILVQMPAAAVAEPVAPRVLFVLPRVAVGKRMREHVARGERVLLRMPRRRGAQAEAATPTGGRLIDRGESRRIGAQRACCGRSAFAPCGERRLPPNEIVAACALAAQRV